MSADTQPTRGSHRGTELPGEESAQGVHEFLGEDHRRLDALFEALVQLAIQKPESRQGKALHLYREFRAGLQRHIRAEEELLFPAFESVTGMVGGPVMVMLREHREIEVVLGEIETRLQAGESPEMLAASLRGVLGPHNVKEESVLYPMTDANLAPAERADLVRRIREILETA